MEKSENTVLGSFVACDLKVGRYRHVELMKLCEYSRSRLLSDIFEPPHGKTNNLHMRKQRRRSASQ